MRSSWEVNNPDELGKVAKEILALTEGFRVFRLTGELGAGKTTLVKWLSKALGAEDTVSSPTFALVNEYGNEPRLYHMDLYRIKSQAELEEIGFEDYLESGKHVFIEWPEIADSVLAHYPSAHILIEHTGNNKRLVILEI